MNLPELVLQVQLCIAGLMCLSFLILLVWYAVTRWIMGDPDQYRK